MVNYKIFPQVIFRAATEPYHRFLQAPKYLNDNNEPLWQGLFLANRSLFERLQTKHFDFSKFTDREKFSVLRYYNRFCNRTTPFGSFAGVGYAHWGTGDQLSLTGPFPLPLLFPDQEILVALSAKATEHLTDEMSMLLNPTLYTLGHEYRYIRTMQNHAPGPYHYSLESMPQNRLLSFLVDLLQKGPMSATELIGQVAALMQTSEVEAEDYIRFLLQAAVIQSDISPNITGPDYSARLQATFPDLPNVSLPAPTHFNALPDAINPPLGNLPEILARNAAMDQLLNAHDIPAPKSGFYAGLTLNNLSGSLDARWQPWVSKAFQVATLLHQHREPVDLSAFKRRFLKRYEQRKVPLLEVMDPHIGIGYLNYDVAADTPFINEVQFGPTRQLNPMITWSRAHQLILGKWSQTGESQEVRLTEDDLAILQVPLENSLPNIVSVMFKLVEGGRMQVDTIGPGFGALLGRFSLWSPDLQAIGTQLAWIEQAENVIYAEILQLSGSHVDNINRRGHLYEYEIPINAISLLPLDKQIRLADLLVSVVNDEVVLVCAARHKRVIPRLSSAFNYQLNHLSLFRFLCDLQYQGKQIITNPDLSSLFPGLSFYPRLAFEKLVFSPARWNLSEKEVVSLIQALQQPDQEVLLSLKRTYQWPDRIALTQHDQQLVFDLRIELDCLLLADSLKGLTSAQLSEYWLPDESSSLRNHAGHPLANQCVSFLHAGSKEAVPPGGSVTKRTPAQRNYPLGGRWLYVKLYCNPSAANWILTHKISPALNDLRKQTPVKWFFIRYNENGYHLRLRLQLKIAFIGPALRLLRTRLGKDLMQVVKEYQADTYKPEWERYGSYLKSVETFFFHSSESVLTLLHQQEIGLDGNYFRDYGLFSADAIITCFHPDLKDQLLFIGSVANSLSAEFNSPTLKKDMDNKYRAIKPQVHALLQPDSYLATRFKNDVGYRKLIRSVSALFKQSRGDEVRRNHLLADLIHMHLNRLFVTRQRESELLTYHCLLKHKVSLQAMSKKC